MLGDQRVDLYGSQAPFVASSLPAPGGQYGYNGEPGVQSHFVLTDGECRIVAFSQDGNIYDKDGFLIADASVPGCQECLEPGTMEMMAKPVPDQCGLYYILSANTGYGCSVHVALLDLTLANVYDEDRKGRLIDLNSELPDLYPVMQAWHELDLLGNTGDSGFDAVLEHSGGTGSTAPMLRAVHSGNGYWLYVILGKRVVQYRVGPDGIHHTPTTAGDYVPTYSNQTPFDIKAYQRDATVALVNGNKVRLALTDMGLVAYPDIQGTPPAYGAIVMRFNAASGALIGNVQGLQPNTSGYPDFINANSVNTNDPGTNQQGPAGIAWVHNATKLVVTGRVVQNNSWVPAIAEYDMLTGLWQDLLPLLNIQGSPLEFVRARLHRNVAPSGTGEALYIPYSGGLAAINGADEGAYGFTVPVAAGSSVPDQYDPPGSPTSYLPRFINAQVAGDQSVVAYNSLACCAMRNAYEGYPGYTFPVIPGTYYWTANSNPFGNCPEVVFLEDLVIPPGVDLYIDDMHLMFGPEARLIIQAAAMVDAENTALTPMECEDRWPGIRVEGDPANLTQNDALQGSLWLHTCLVEEAHTGVWCAREGQVGHFGGIVRSYNSTFMDCIVGVRIERYHRLVGTNELLNKCVFSNTDFKTTIGWPDPQVYSPNRHVWLYHVNGVTFNNCSFVNEAPVLWPNVSQRGRGIHAVRATFRCNGYQNYTENRFANLTYGAFISSPDPAWAYWMKGMAFVNNNVGLYDFFGVNALITNNKCTTLALNTTQANSSIGLFLYQSRGYTVERNEFWDGDNVAPEVPSVGVWFRGPATMDNRIYDNDFHNLNAGNVVQGDHEGTAGGQPPSVTGLQMLCNDYTADRVDQFIMANGYIRLKQGEPTSVNVTANNRFNNDADCSTTFEPYVDPLRNPDLPNIKYYYFAGSFPELRPECVEAIDLGPDETWIGGHFDLIGTQDPDNLDFDPTVHCNGGVLDAGSDHVSELLAAYGAKLAEYKNAVEAYRGQVDNGDKETPLEAIAAEPAWPSHQLRDLLLLHSPLSDTVMIMAIRRPVPMDPWHLTQVLIGNSKVSEVIWRELDVTGVLPPFFYNLLAANQSSPSLRTVLQDEAALRSAEKSRILQRIQLALDEDSLFAGKVDTLMAVYLADSMGSGLEMAYRLAVHHGRYTKAAQIKARLPLTMDVQLLTQLGDLEETLGGDWESANGAQRDLLWEWAFTRDRQASADAWALLHQLGETDSLPEALLPRTYRAAYAGGELGAYVPEPTLSAYPNPAADRLMITLPAGLDHATLELLDATGKLVNSTQLASAVPFVELDVHALTAGLYLARLTFEGLMAGECKFTIAR